MSQTVAGSLIDVLEKIGVKHIFGLISDSLNPIGDVVRTSKIEWIGVRHGSRAGADGVAPDQYLAAPPWDPIGARVMKAANGRPRGGASPRISRRCCSTDGVTFSGGSVAIPPLKL
jgi:hypothetical protein